MVRRSVTLQVSLAPPDVAHAVHILPHQIRTLAGQADEVLLVLDRRKGRVARFSAGWDAALPRMVSFLEQMTREHPDVRVADVDYGREPMRRVAETFFARSSIPAKDLRGGAFYGYFFAIAAASHDLVLHLDSDMLLGGASRSWIREAVELLEGDDDAIAVCPLPGPPAADGQLRDQERYAPQRDGPRRFRFRHFTSRVFLCDRRRLARPERPLPLLRETNRLVQAKTKLAGQSSYALPEQLITVWMEEHRLARIDFLGRAPGLWAVHPVERSEHFIRELAGVIARIENGNVTDEQLGRYNLHPSMLTR